jgi:cysteine desulfurase / selenocysteine lyase
MDETAIARARRDTPGCERVAHFNNAGAALPPAPVLAAQIRHLEREAEIGGYEAAEEARDRHAAVYASVARLLGASTDEIALVDSATTAWDLAFYGMRWRPGDRILTSEAEYASNFLAFLHASRRLGVEIDVVPSDEHGQLDTDALARRIDDRTKLIALTHVPTNGGLVNPAEEVGAIARRAGVTFLLDACQSVGQLPIDVAAIGCDFLSATGRKYLRGPRGTGFLYVRREALERLDPPRLDLASATWTAPRSFELAPGARRFELWERNVAATLGLGVAIEYALAWGMEAIAARIAALASELRAKLAEIPAVAVRDLGRRRCGIVSFTVAGRAPAQVRGALRQQAINVSTSGEGSTLLDMRRRGLDCVVRASVHYYNTPEEIDRLCRGVAELASY